MTTKRDDKSNKVNDVRSSSLPPVSVYNLQYPNCRTGMYSLRAPFKYPYINETLPQQQTFTRSLTSDIIPPKFLYADEIQEQERPFIYHPSQRDAQVQCSLVSPRRDGMGIRRNGTNVINSYAFGDLSPGYRVPLNLQPTQTNAYEIWESETPPPRTIPVNRPIHHRREPPRIRVRSPPRIRVRSPPRIRVRSPPRIRVRSPRSVYIEPISDDDESDYDDDGIVYARYPQRTYLPSNVRMVCVRQDANTICY